jgi:hypothetical protein
MRTKTILLGSVSAIATAAAGAGHAQAATTTPSATGYTFSVQGGLALTPAEQSLAGYAEDKAGSGFDMSLDDLDQAFGYNAAVTIGKDLGNGWDVRFGASTSATGISSGYASGSFGSGYSYSSGSSGYSSSFSAYTYQSLTEQFSFQALDFEVGYTPVLTDTLSVRLFGGIRAVHSEYDGTGTFGYGASGSNSSYTSSAWSGDSGYGYIAYQAATKTEFFGAGPRFGIDVSKRFDGTNFGISGRIAGSVLFGQQTSSTSGFAYSGFYNAGSSGGYSGASAYTTSSYSSAGSGVYPQNSNYTVDKKIADVEAQIGLDYYLDDSTALTVGYQAEKFIDMDDSDNSHTTHGAFLKLSGSF